MITQQQRDMAEKEIVSRGLVHYAIISAFEAGIMSPKQSDFFDFYNHAALSMMLAVNSGECAHNQRYKVLSNYFDRVYGKYGKWADNVIEAVREKKNDGKRIRAFDTYYVSSMRDPYASFCNIDKDVMRNIEKRLNMLSEDYKIKNQIIQSLQKAA